MKEEVTITIVVDATRDNQLGASNDGLGFGIVVGIRDGDSVIIGIGIKDSFQFGGDRAHSPISPSGKMQDRFRLQQS